MDRFIECWDGLDDPRTGNAALHDFHEILAIAMCAVLCGGQGSVDMGLFAKAKEPFLRGFLKLENGVPSHDTFSRLFRMLDPEQFRAAFQRFMAGFSEQCEGVVAIDGKVLRRSFDSASGKSPLHMVSAWGCEQRLVLAQIATDAKSNEITAVPKLLEMLRLKGTIVTADALNCQRAIAQQIVDQGGDYALALKGNQGTLHDDVVLYLDDPASKTITAEPVVDADHGRIETRTATVSTDIAWLIKDHQWPGLAAVGKVERIRETAGKTTFETAYYLLSAPLTPERFNEVVRAHWGVENRLHWRLDVVMNEDQDRSRLGNGPHNLAVLRHMANPEPAGAFSPAPHFDRDRATRRQADRRKVAHFSSSRRTSPVSLSERRTLGRLTRSIRRAAPQLCDYLERLDASEDGATSIGARTKEPAEKIEALRKKRGRYEAMLTQLDRVGEDQISLTDLDGRAMAAAHTGPVGYNAQVAVDAKNKMIVEQAVTNQVVDMGLLTQTAEPRHARGRNDRRRRRPRLLKNRGHRGPAAFLMSPSLNEDRRCARVSSARTSSDTTPGATPRSARPASC